MSILTAAPDTVLADGRQVCIIRAHQLQPGDVWVEADRIDLSVTSVSDNPIKAGFVVIHYRVGSSRITGERGKTALAFVAIIPRTEEAH